MLSVSTQLAPRTVRYAAARYASSAAAAGAELDTEKVERRARLQLKRDLQSDHIWRLHVDDLRVSGVVGTRTLATARERWGMSPTATHEWGNSMLATTMNASFLSGEERVIAELRGTRASGREGEDPNVYSVVEAIGLGEVRGFLKPPTLDTQSKKDMKINFDITMFDLPCKHLRLSVWDKFGGEQIQSKDKFHYIPIDHTGAFKGQAYTSEELAALERADTQTDVTEEEKKDLDADWSSSDDHFNHHDFGKAVSFHDFTLVNFYAEWCVHCRNFHPTWMSAKEKISEKMAFTDADGKQTTVKMLKINCVDFQAACQENKIAAFPSIRLYKRDGTFDPFSGQRSIDNIISFLTSSIKNSHLIVAHHHAMFTEGCKVTGWLNVPRAPGHFHLQADSLKGNVNVNPAFTNVSHSVNHLSFGERDAKLWATRQQIPKEIINHLSPLDNQSFAVEHFHQAPQHYLKVVTTRVQGKKDLIYQMTHTNRVRKLKDTQAAPQARFSYDISPLSVVVKVKQKRWYEFLTSLFAILGGTFTIVELTSGAVDTVHTAVKEAIGKDS